MLLRHPPPRTHEICRTDPHWACRRGTEKRGKLRTACRNHATERASLAFGQAMKCSITHEEMTRYFMTIPEAVYLVLQAATLASAGDVYMLDMGDPVKITDLATRLITLSGLQPGKDIEVKFVGVRPGEKIHEQLWFESSSVQRTSFPRVLAVLPRPVSDEFEAKVQQLEKAALARDDESVLQHLRALPIDFQGSPAPEVVLRPSVENWRPAASGVGAD